MNVTYYEKISINNAFCQAFWGRKAALMEYPSIYLLCSIYFAIISKSILMHFTLPIIRYI